MTGFTPVITGSDEEYGKQLRVFSYTDAGLFFVILFLLLC